VPLTRPRPGDRLLRRAFTSKRCVPETITLRACATLLQCFGTRQAWKATNNIPSWDWGPVDACWVDKLIRIVDNHGRNLETKHLWGPAAECSGPRLSSVFRTLQPYGFAAFARKGSRPVTASADGARKAPILCRLTAYREKPSFCCCQSKSC